ncbi:MAG: peptidyl-prolyl cis-trans isomerase [Pseudomonadota bacterium]
MKRLALTLSITLALTACGSSEPAPDVLAQVGDVVITTDQYQEELELRAAMRPGYYELAEHREELLEFLVNQQVQLNAARRAGIPEERDFKDLYERMLIQRLRETRLEADLAEVSISDADIVSYYEANLDQFSRPERRQVALVRLSRPGREDEAALQALRERAEEARAAALALPEDTGHFGAVAVEYSDDRGSRYQGGVVGWLVDSDNVRYRLPADVISIAFEQQAIGDISPVIETGEALWLVRVVELDPARQQPLEQVREGIHHRLTRERAEALEEGLVDTLRDEETIVLNKALLDTIPIPPSIPPEREAAPQDRRPPPLPGGATSDDDSGSAES